MFFWGCFMRKITSFLIVAGMLALGMALLGCGSVPPAETLGPDATTATVYFIMPGSGVTMTGWGSLTVGTQFSLWDSDMFLSNIGSKEYLMFYMKAGTHYFMASGENWYVVEADLAPGKTYYFEVATLPGFSRPNALLKFIEPGDPELDKFLQSSKMISPKGKTSDSIIRTAGERSEEAKSGSHDVVKVTADKGV